MDSEFDRTSETEMPLNEAWNSRRIFTDDQRNELVKVFEETPYPKRNKLEELAQRMRVSIDSVRKWFQSTRTYNPNKPMPSLSCDHHETKDSKSDCKSKKEKPLKIAVRCRKFTVGQRNELMRVLEETRYPDRRKMMELAERMRVSFHKISMWFRNTRRIKPRTKPSQAMSSSTHNRQKTVSSESDCKTKKKKPQPLKIMSRRRRFTVDQRNELIRVLEETRYPGKRKMVELAQKMGVSSPNISTWFRNKRRTQRNKQLVFSSTCDRQETVCPESVCKSGKKKPLKIASCRKRFTVDQRKELIQVFEETPYPTRNKMEELGQRMGASFHSITKWFQNTRTYNPHKLKLSSSHEHHKTVDSDSNYRCGTINPLKTASCRTFTDDERSELVRVFEKTPCLRRNKLEKLALKMGVPFHNINSWFKNTRRYNREKVGSDPISK
ncbi:uncharacterized protein [Mycetomoellerius zeteki]|uniref:uncharacterized protein isoform X2 n=1 Tax=Mycetomoellerius zeteki TaxID=64791 RepID=UPI00084E5974|nr:PREDICTED: uncharacterized protein LOC108722025 isoform X2 [Trachymyrmex zeteki]